MRRVRAAVLLALITAASISGCGGSVSVHAFAKHPSTSSTRTSSSNTITDVTVQPSAPVGGMKTFNAPGIDIHFSYPANFRSLPLAPPAGLPVPRAVRAGVGLAVDNLIIVTAVPGAYSATPSKLAAAKSKIDRRIRRVLGPTATSRLTTVGGLPALRYRPASPRGAPAGLVVAYTSVYTPNRQYQLSCEYTPQHALAIVSACLQMLATFHR
ncbi:MAG: hypothetical protein M3Z27_01415 [Actinomycetota bacterium]|nr:hypothetical protein [Actinomycetota bacterium]